MTSRSSAAPDRAARSVHPPLDPLGPLDPLDPNADGPGDRPADVPADRPADLTSLGWDAGYAAALAARADPALRPARVSRVDRAGCDLLTGRHPGPRPAVLARALLARAAADPLAAPGVGDWVGWHDRPDGRLVVETVLDRRTALTRGAVAPGSSAQQLLAANVDLVLLVEPLLPEPDLGRVERLLALAWASGTQPVVVLTKADLVGDAPDQRADLAAAAPGAEVLVASAVTGAGLAAVRDLAQPGRTLALVGASGAGKSTLANLLAGAPVMATRGPRSDGKGRHTTAHRQLLVLPGGGCLLDTPGLRSVGLTPQDEALTRVFADVEELAAACRFADCAHDREPGCAVTAAVAAGDLPERRLASWRKLGREARWQAARQDARLRAQDRARSKRLSVAIRRSVQARS